MKINVTPPHAELINNGLQPNALKWFSHFIILPVLLLSCIQSGAQTNFQADLLRNSHYYDSLISVRGIDSMQGTGYTQYQRWFRYWAPKLLPDKDYSDYQNQLLEYAGQYSVPNNSNTGNVKWKLIGPNGYGNDIASKFTGQIHYMYKKPNDESGRIFACSPVGGLFISMNNGDNWVNAGTDKGLPRSGVSSVVVDKYNYWYVTTGNGESYLNNTIWQQSYGVYRSTDQGASWNKIGLDTINNTVIQNMRKVIDISPANSENTSLLVSTTQGIFRIDNANLTGPEINLHIPGEFYDIEPYIGNSDFFYTSGSGTTGVYKINRADNTFTNLNFPFQDLIIPGAEINTQRITIETTEQFPDNLYAIYTVYYKHDLGEFSFLLKYNNEDGWINRGQLPQSVNEAFTGHARSLGWDMAQINDELVLVGCNVHPFKCVTNINGTGELVVSEYNYPNDDPHDDCHYILLDDGTNEIWAGTDGGAMHGTINGQNIDWQIKNKGLGVATVEYMDAYKHNITGFSFATSGQFDCGSFLYETVDEINWDETSTLGGDGYQTIITNESNFFTSYQNGIIRKNWDTNFINGDTFAEQDVNCEPTGNIIPYANWNTYYDINNGYLYMTGQKEVRRFNISSPDWVDWSSFSNNTNYPEMGCAKSGTWEIAVTGDTNNTMYVSTYGGDNYSYFQVYKSNGGGTSPGAWKLIKNNPVGNKWITSIKPMIASENELYVAIRESIYKINTTNPESASWNSISYDLSVGIINCIEVETNRIWVGTDKGVYYLDNGTTTWVNYSSTLPNVEVMSIKVEENQVYAETYGRGVWFASTPECGSASTKTINPGEYVCEQCTKTYYGDVIIPPGVTYYVYGTLKMGAGCRIIVQRNAKLIVDGGTITNACPDMWGGIEVWGTSDKVQTAQYQGIVQLTNASIEHAETAIKTIKTAPGLPGGYDQSYSGGIVFAINTIFTDNATAAIFYPYPVSSPYLIPDLSSISYFVDCDFNYTDDIFYFNPNRSLHHIILSGIKGMRFDDCQFNRQTPDHADYMRNMGIQSTDAGFQVINSSFNSLDYGIYCSNTMLGIKSISIDQNQFVNNWRGIYMGAVDYPTVTRNTFSIKNPFDIPDPWVVASGLYMDNCTGYSIEENVFYSNYSHSFQNLSEAVGVVLNNSGTENNFLYNNEFHNLPYGTVAQNVNRNYNGDKGLQIKCNDYSENYVDIAVTYSGNPSNMNGVPHQGSNVDSITAPAGNRFSRLGETPYSDFDNQCGLINYHLPKFRIAIKRLWPIFYRNISLSVNIDASYTWDSISGCPSNLTSHTIPELKSLAASNQAFSEVYTDSLNTLVDAGNTTALTLDVATSIPPETMQLRSELLDASPYLSDTVMVSTVEKEEVLPNSILTEILTSNPQSAKSQKVLNKLNERQTPPTENQMALIHTNDTVLGHKEKLESGMAHYSALQHQAVGQLVRLYMKDSIQVGITDSIEQALSFIQSPSSIYRQAFCRFCKGDSLGALNRLDEVPLEFDLTQQEAELQSDYEDYFALLLELRFQGKNIDEVDSLQKSLLYTILQHGENQLQAYCRNILIQSDSYEYNEPYLFPYPIENKADEIKKPAANFAADSQPYFKLYPNPAKEYITVEYSLESGSSVFEIYSISGIRKHAFKPNMAQGIKTIDLRGWESGIYVIKLTSKGRLLQTEKFTKQ